MTKLEILKAARAKIASGWCQQSLAKDVYGSAVNPFWEEAVAWCAYGALSAVCPTYDREPNNAATSLANCLPAGRVSLAGWNDDTLTTQTDVLALYDRAIEMEETNAAEIDRVG